MKSILSVLILSLLVLSQSIAQKDPVAKEILDAMSARYQNIPSFSAEFSYVMEYDGEGGEDGFSGVIMANGEKYKLNMKTNDIYFDGSNIYTYDKENNELIIDVPDPEADEISLSNIFDIYKTGFKYVYGESKAKGTIDVVDLVPEDKEKDYFKIRMDISSKTKELKSFTVFDKSGSKFIYTIKTFNKIAALADKIFVFDQTKFKNLEVIDLR